MKKKLYSYKNSGVDISLGNKFVKHINKLTNKNVKKTNKNKYQNNIGSFGSLYDISSLNVKNPVIVSCTDGVGTKLELSHKYNKLNTNECKYYSNNLYHQVLQRYYLFYHFFPNCYRFFYDFELMTTSCK